MKAFTCAALVAAFAFFAPGLAASMVVIVPVAAVPSRQLKVVTPADMADIHKIAVVAPVLDKVVIQYVSVGSSLFGGGVSESPIADWKLGDMARSIADHTLGANFEISTSGSEAGEPFAGVDAQPMSDASKFLGRVVRSIHNPVVDAYLVLWPGAEPFPGSNFFVIGAGVDRLPPLMKSRPELHYGEADIHLLYDAYLVRASDGKVIAVSTGEVPHGPASRSIFKAGPDVLPRRWTGRMSWSRNAAAMTDDERTVLRETLSDLLQTSLPYTLTRMGLVPPPAP